MSLMDDTPVSLGAYSMSFAVIKENLEAIVNAIKDPSLDCEETMKVIEGKALEAHNHIEAMRKALEG